MPKMTRIMKTLSHSFRFLHIFLGFAYFTIVKCSDGLLPPPPELTNDTIITIKRTLVGGGPSNQYPRALAALNFPVMGNFDNGSLKDVKKGLQYVFQTENPWTVALSGGGSMAMDIVLDNLVEPGDVVLIPTIGLWGHRAASIVERLGGIPVKIEKPFGSAFPGLEIKNGILTHRPAILYITNGESSTGVVQSIQALGEFGRVYGCLLVVDTVATLGVMPFHVDAWNVDASFTNTQKALGSPVGLAPITYGPRAIEKIMKRQTKPRTYFGDLKNNWIPNNYWGIDPTRSQTFHSSYPILQLYALREALATLATEGLESVWQRHNNATQRFYAGIPETGLEYFVPNSEERLVGTIAFLPPKGMLPRDLQNVILQKFGYEINTGIGSMSGKLIRIGIFGANAQSEIVDQLLVALKYGLKALSVQ